MNFARTALLLAAMTALFLVVGYLIAGEGGALTAFVIALAMNVIAHRPDASASTPPARR